MTQTYQPQLKTDANADANDLGALLEQIHGSKDCKQ